MTFDEIAETFIRSMETDHKMPMAHDRPAPVKSMNLPYVATYMDQAGWFPAPDNRKSEWKDQLLPGDLGRYDEIRNQWWQGGRPTPEAVSEWERLPDLAKLVTNEENRKALWAWARAKAGGPSFAKWMRKNGIKKCTGNRRRIRALAEIEASLARQASQNAEITPIDVLPNHPVITHVPDTVGGSDGGRLVHIFRSDDAFSPIPRPELRDTSWADRRNALRRQRKLNSKKRNSKKQKQVSPDTACVGA